MKKTIQKKRIGPYNFQDFCLRVREDQKADLIDGVIYMASPENTDANRLFVWLTSIITFFVYAKRLGEVFGSRVACQLDDINAPEPDILFIRKDQCHRVERGRIQGAPDLAMELVSPESVERDYEDKRAKYEQAGVLEYWIIDEHEHQITLLRLDARGKFREVRPRQGVYSSQVITGFWLRPEWLWQDPLPNPMDILNQIIAPPK